VTVGKSHNKIFDPVYMHFDFDDYKPDLMMRVEPTNKNKPITYVLHRMVPPGKSIYFFTINHEYFYAKDHLKLQNRVSLLVKNVKFNEVLEDDGRPPDSDDDEEETEFSYMIKMINYTSGKPKEVLNKQYEPIPRI